ncbi:MAG: discoidin domain-containing protein, partial [Planctomycetota bacterium]
MKLTGFVSADGPVTPEQDAIGACDGIKDGTWGFHTERERDPWWQIDLAESRSLERIVIFNRCDLADRALRLSVLLSRDGETFRQIYQHDGTAFFGHTDGKPLIVTLDGKPARYVRLRQPGTDYLHLDEVEIYARDAEANIALGKNATQSSTSQWSKRHSSRTRFDVDEIITRGLKLAQSLGRLGLNVGEQVRTLNSLGEYSAKLQGGSSAALRQELYLQARSVVRKMTFSNPLLDFETILFVKRAPGTLPHMADQYYGWWSRPGGGIYLLEAFKNETPHPRCLTENWPAGNFLRPDLSYDGRKVLFAYCKYYPHVAGMEKVDKQKLPEDAFYHVFEMNLDGTGVRRLTHGRYDDFDARYLPDGDIVFLSTRKGQFVQCSKANTSVTEAATLPDSYVRCGGDNTRPCAVFTLHAIDSDGGNLRPLSAFENFEWTPSVAMDAVRGRRWANPLREVGLYRPVQRPLHEPVVNEPGRDESAARLWQFHDAAPVHLRGPVHPRFRQASSHHSITGGSLALLDRARGTEGPGPLIRLTPDVCFPEADGWPEAYYANPYPLSEDHYLAAWSDCRLPPHQGSRPVTDRRNPANALGLYLADAFGNLELIYRDPAISSMYPIPVRPRSRPFAQSCQTDWDGCQEGRFLVQDVYRGLEPIERGRIESLRIVGVPPKTQPHMNSPSLGVSREDPGKFVLGTVPVEKDGSAYFCAPSGVPV